MYQKEKKIELYVVIDIYIICLSILLCMMSGLEIPTTEDIVVILKCPPWDINVNLRCPLWGISVDLRSPQQRKHGPEIPCYRRYRGTTITTVELKEMSIRA